MIFKSRVDLGLQVLHHLKAAADEGQRMTVAQLTKKTGKSTSFIEQIMMVLKGMGLVESLRGPGGGYVLKRDGSGTQYRYHMLSLGSFSYGFYPKAPHSVHLMDSFALKKLTYVIG